MIKAIEISLLRVSSNGKYIEFIINCPNDYYFTEFTVQVYGSTDVYSLSDIFKEDGEYKTDVHEYSGQFLVTDVGAIEENGHPKPEMYEIHLYVESNDDIDDHGIEEVAQKEETAYISDVSNVYDCLMKDILSVGESICSNDEVQDRVIRNYLILYAHQEAMNFRELADAKKYFDILSKCFSKCGESNSCQSCNSNYTIYKPSNCGCK